MKVFWNDYRFKNIFTILLCLFVPLLFSACTSQAVKEETKEEEVQQEQKELVDIHSDDGRMVVGISMPSDHIERWHRDGAYLKQKLEEKDYEVLLSYAHDKIDIQTRDIEQMVEQGADVLVIAPVDSSALTEVLKDASDVNIPIIAYDRLLMKTFSVDYYVSFDNYEAGRLQGRFVEKMLHLKDSQGKVFHAEFSSGDVVDHNAWCFYSGMYEVLSPYLESGVLTVRSGQTDFFETATPTWSRDLSYDRFLGLLSSFYMKEENLDAAICANDSIARGVMDAIAEDYKKDNPIIVTGQDGDEENLKDIIDGKQSMTVYRALDHESMVTARLVEAIFKNESIGEEIIEEAKWNFPCTYDSQSYDNGKKTVPSFLLEPTVITKDNIQSDLIDTGFYQIGEDGYPTAAK